MTPLNVNGRVERIDADPSTPVLWALRDHLGLTGTKFGCGIAQCGACTVHLEGEPLRACVTPLAAVVGRRVTTIEGLSADGSHPLQQAWVAEQVPQCGYCQAGQIMEAAALLRRTPHPDRGQIVAAMDGHLCRCGTYLRIVRAIERAAGKEGVDGH